MILETLVSIASCGEINRGTKTYRGMRRREKLNILLILFFGQITLILPEVSGKSLYLSETSGEVTIIYRYFFRDPAAVFRCPNAVFGL